MTEPHADRPDADIEQRQTAKWLEETFARYQEELLGLLYHLVGNAEDARDALQDTFIKCWKHRDDLADIENLRAWIFRVALNTGRDLRATAWRRHRRPLEEGESLLIATANSPEANVLQRERLTLVRRAIRQLRPEEQEVFLLRQNGQLTYEQIAESTDTPVGTVKTRMRAVLAKLREAVEEKTM